MSFPTNLTPFAPLYPGDSNRVISDLKFKLVKAEQESTALEQNVSREEWVQSSHGNILQAAHSTWLLVGFQVTRLEGQVMRYKTAAENSEKVEDELKAEKRKLQRGVASSAPAHGVGGGGVDFLFIS